MGSEVASQNEGASYLHLLNRWKDFCHYYNLVSSHIELINKDRLELSSYICVKGFEEDGLDEKHITKHFIGIDSDEKGILKIKRISNSQSPMFTLTFISSSAASEFLSREVKYREKALNCFLLSDLVKRLKMESRPRNFRDETRYREQDIGRRILVILKPNTIWEDKDLQQICFGAKEKVPDLEHVFKCEIDEEHSKSFSGQYIITFNKTISSSSFRPVENDRILYVGLLKDYITQRAHIIKENPIERRVLSPPPAPPKPLETDLSAISLASEDQNRFSLELFGFSSVCIDIREYVIKIMKLEHVERSKDKVSDPLWRETYPIGFIALFSLNVCDKKSEQLIQIWNDKAIKIKDCVIRARSAK